MTRTRMKTDARARRAIDRIIATDTVSTADWKALGLPFEAWLRYCQVDKATRKTFRGAMIAQWRRDAAKES